MEKRHCHRKEVMDLANKPMWMKDLHRNHLKPLVHATDGDWAGLNDDFSVQVNIVKGRGDKVNPHCDSQDVSHQHGL